MHIDFVDSTLRDGQQSLWGLNMRAFEAAGALAPLSETGFSTIDLTGPGMFQVLTRDYHDDPWDHLDFLVRSQWDPAGNEYGGLGMIYGPLGTSFIALLIAVPVIMGAAIGLLRKQER